MSNKIEIRELLDVYEKEALMNNSLKLREENIEKYKYDIDNQKSKDLDGTDEHLTFERGGCSC